MKKIEKELRKVKRDLERYMLKVEREVKVLDDKIRKANALDNAMTEMLMYNVRDNTLDNAMTDFGDDEEWNAIVAEVLDGVLIDKVNAAPPPVQGTPGGRYRLH